MVIIANNYTNQGNNKINISAKITSFIAQVKDFFEIRPLQINSLQTLTESQSKTVSEIAVKNNLNTKQYFSWTLNSGQQNITSSNLLNISSTNLFIYIASNYTNEGVYRTQATINSTLYNDTEKGVIIT